MANKKLDSGHDIIIGRGTTRVSGDEYIIQLVKCRLLFILGTWELDPTLGIPWYSELLVRDVGSTLFRGVIADCIKNTKGVAQVDKLKLTLDEATRTLNITFTGKTINNTIFGAEVNSGGSTN